MKGIILVNPYKVPKQSLFQAERLQTELNNLGVDTEIISDGYAHASAESGGLRLDERFSNANFFVYFDKDKYLSAILEACGKRVFDTHSAIRVCDDKGDTCLALACGGFPVPKTIFTPPCYTSSMKTPDEFFVRAEAELSYPMIIKKSYGSMGKGVYMAKNREELSLLIDEIKTDPHILQEYVGYKRGTDVRVIVVGGTAAAAMLRVNEKDFRSNIALGGKGTKIDVNDKTSCYAEFIDLAERAAQYLGADYCGVDLLFGKKSEPIICEVNSNAFFEEIERVTEINVAMLYARHIKNSIENN